MLVQHCVEASHATVDRSARFERTDAQRFSVLPPRTADQAVSSARPFGHRLGAGLAAALDPLARLLGVEIDVPFYFGLLSAVFAGFARPRRILHVLGVVVRARLTGRGTVTRAPI
jgi:hypothetical protein